MFYKFQFGIQNSRLQLSQTSVIEALPVNSHALFDHQINLECDIKDEINVSSITVRTSSSFHFETMTIQTDTHVIFYKITTCCQKLNILTDCITRLDTQKT